MNKRKTEFYTGLFVLAGIICSLYLYVNIGSLKLKNDFYSVYAYFNSVAGLKVGARVEMAGVKIGTVSDITIDKKQLLAKVEFHIDKNMELQEDIIASIKTSGIIGQKYIDILPGGSDIMLEPGEEIYHTESTLDFESMIRKYIFNTENQNKL